MICTLLASPRSARTNRDPAMGIKAPSLVTFAVSVLLTLAVLLAKIGVSVPLVSGYEFLVLLVAQILLILGCTVRGF